MESKTKNVKSTIAFLLHEIRKIIQTVATICQILRLKPPKFNFGWGSAIDPVGGGAYSIPPDPLGGLKGTYFKGKGGGECCGVQKPLK